MLSSALAHAVPCNTVLQAVTLHADSVRQAGQSSAVVIKLAILAMVWNIALTDCCFCINDISSALQQEPKLRLISQPQGSRT